MQMRARIGMVVLALAVAGGLALGFYPRAVPVDTVAVGKGPLTVSVEEEGKTRVMERYVISAPVAGYARRIDLHVGDAIQSGQVLVALEPSRSEALDPRTRAQALAQVKTAEAAVAARREEARVISAQSDLAEKELARVESLRKSNFVSAQALDRSQSEVARSQAAKLAANHAVNVARYELEVARAALIQTTRMQSGAPAETVQVRSPVSGSVLKVQHESEGAVQAGQPLIEIGNSQALEVEVEVLSTQAVKIAPGGRVMLDRWGGEATLEGAVRVVEPTAFTKISALGVEEQRVRVIVDFVSPREDWQRLGDGYRVEARFIVWEGKDVMQIPASALFRYNSGWAAYAMVSGRARLKPVEIGRRAGLVVEVLSGVSAGDDIISHPDDKISDGTRVKPRKS